MLENNLYIPSDFKSQIMAKITWLANNFFINSYKTSCFIINPSLSLTFIDYFWNIFIAWRGLFEAVYLFILFPAAMKFKKEYRWLLFLIIPFIIFMIILIITPLEFLLKAQPLATQAYTIKMNLGIQDSLRSATYISSMNINSYFQQVDKLIDIFESINSE